MGVRRGGGGGGVGVRGLLGPLLFNIYLNDLFFFLKDVSICNFVDDTATYIFDESLGNVLNHLRKTLCLLYVGLKIII